MNFWKKSDNGGLEQIQLSNFSQHNSEEKLKPGNSKEEEKSFGFDRLNINNIGIEDEESKEFDEILIILFNSTNIKQFNKIQCNFNHSMKFHEILGTQ